ASLWWHDLSRSKRALLAVVLLLAGALPLSFIRTVSRTSAVLPHQKVLPLPVTPRDLLTFATQIGNTDKVGYQWLSSHELLGDDCPHISGNRNPLFYRYDTRTGQRTTLTALNHLVAESLIYHGASAVSPDGQWLLWQNEGSGTFAARMDGTGYHEWPGHWA